MCRKKKQECDEILLKNDGNGKKTLNLRMFREIYNLKTI